MPTKKRASTPDDFESEEDSKPKKQKTESPKKTPVKWTAEEDRIIVEIMEQVVQAGIWDAIKKDGRLVHRKADGIKVHSKSLLNKMKKG